MAKSRTVHICGECGYESVRWLGRCPVCKQYNTFEETLVAPPVRGATSVVKSAVATAPKNIAAVKLEGISQAQEFRYPTHIAEFDRVLGGGIVKGSVCLVGGEPGIGKSTLLLQICQSADTGGKPALYVSGEESLAQIKQRAMRLGCDAENIYIMAETSVPTIVENVRALAPGLMIIDSIQTMDMEGAGSGAGSVTQVRECAACFMELAKTLDVPVIMVGHVTKEGGLAGPRVLEHMVDTVLYFEGDRQMSCRIVRAVKNRFGSTNEVGVFEMVESGLVGVENPSEYMLAGRPIGVAGSVITCSMEGTRPIMTEVQALVTATNFGMPRRVATGMDYNRVSMLIAMLEKRTGYKLGNYDAYVNIVGGMRITEPALDLAAAAAIASSFRNRSVPPQMAIFGEAGLTGEARAVSMADKRVLEAAKLGFKECIIPQANLKGLKHPQSIRVYGVSGITELLDLALS